MKKHTIILIIIAAALVLVGSIIFGGVMTVMNWDFTKLSTVKYETNTHKIIDAFRDISVDTDTADIVFLPSAQGGCSVVCVEESNMKHSVAVENGALSIKLTDTRKWYQHIGVNFGTSKITVYLPAGEYGALKTVADTGDLSLPNDFSFESLDILESTGDVTSAASVSGDVRITASTGKINFAGKAAGSLTLATSTGDISVSNTACEGDVNITVSTGKTSLSNVSCKNVVSRGSTGRITLKNVVAAEKFSIKRSTGKVTFDGSDAAEIFVETDTGDVSGTLLSEKVFITETSTGRINVPKSISGGRCEISTSTGNIIISIN